MNYYNDRLKVIKQTKEKMMKKLLLLLTVATSLFFVSVWAQRDVTPPVNPQSPYGDVSDMLSGGQKSRRDDPSSLKVGEANVDKQTKSEKVIHVIEFE